jgi:hypothetical protein
MTTPLIEIAFLRDRRGFSVQEITMQLSALQLARLRRCLKTLISLAHEDHKTIFTTRFGSRKVSTYACLA